MPQDSPSMKLKILPGLLAVVGLVLSSITPVAAAYSAQYTPASFASANSASNDMVKIVFDVLQAGLNLSVMNWLTLLMIFVAVVLIAWGAVTRLFRRGKKRGR